MPHSLYVSDLDFTLLDADGQISDTSLALLSRWLDEGLAFTVASARAWNSIREALRGLPLRLPAITSNGACISDVAGGRHLDVAALDSGIADSLFATLEAAGHSPLVSSTDGGRDSLRFGALANPGIAAFHDERHRRGDIRLRPHEDRRLGLSEQVICLTVIAPAPAADEVIALLEAGFAGVAHWNHMTATMHPGHHWITITAPGADKGNALGRLRRLCGLESGTVVAYGDDVQDLPMLAAADVAVAMANARPPVRAAAHEQAGHHAEDGVVRHMAQRLSLSGYAL